MRGAPPLHLVLASTLAILAFASVAQAQPAGTSGQAVDLQGDPRGFMKAPQVRAFYDLSVATLRPGSPPVDVATYEAKAFALFRELGAAMGASPAAMQDHLKLIPRQVVQIVKEDPKVLDSFEAFVDALVGPR